MAANGIIKDDTVWNGMDSSGVMTATRYIHVAAGNMSQLDLAESTLMPQNGDAHPTNPMWTVDSIGEIQHSDIPNEYRIAIRYKRVSGGTNISISGGTKEVKPWDTGIFNHHSSWGQVEVPLLQLYDAQQKKYIDLKTSAGQIIPATKPMPYRIETFQFNCNTEKYHKKMPRPGLLNCNTETLFGKKIPPYSGKIMRMESEDHVVYKNDGKTVKWKYETISWEVHWFGPEAEGMTWVMDFLNVGNMFIKTVNGNPVRKRIYQYTPWTSTDASVNAQIQPVFGSIDDVIAARNAYQKVLKDAGEDYSKEIPWEEASDIPLTSTGAIDTAAIAGTKAYDKISGYESKGESWSPYLPSEARKPV